MDITLENTYLGIELGSTRIKAVLINDDYSILASGNYDWENQLIDGMWTYSQDDVWHGVQSAYKQLAAQIKESYGITIKTFGRICISAMMHGYLAFGEKDDLLVPFRTWRNTNTSDAAERLSAALEFNIPLRWSAAHFYQAAINKEKHIRDVSYITTLAGYVHWKLTGEKVLGVGDASGMFPVDAGRYHEGMLSKFREMCVEQNAEITGIMPKILLAGEDAGKLTAQGALLLDPGGVLKPGIPFCPPEGDAGTGMVATNSTAALTGNVSAGTSIFAMVVLQNSLCGAYPEIDVVATPDGKQVAMVHCNNCTSDIDAWLRLFGEFSAIASMQIDDSDLYEHLYAAALRGEPDCGGLLAYNYLSGEPITGLAEGRPLFMRLPVANFTFANFCRAMLYSAVATLRLGMDILTQKENVNPKLLNGHGGLFKVPGVGQRVMAAALKLPISVNNSAAEGGAWGAALLAAYASQKREGESLDIFLKDRVFADVACTVINPLPRDASGFDNYLDRYVACLETEQTAVRNLTM